MNIKWHSVRCVALALLLAGCGYSPDMLREASFKGSPFQDFLAARYRDYSTLEEQRYNWNNAIHFADKGLLLAYGNDAPPENVGDWDIHGEAKAQLEQARARLMAALTPYNIDAEPGAAAKAQFSFDCWVDEQEKAWKSEDIADCRDNFKDALGVLEKINAEPGEKTVKHKAKKHANAKPRVPKSKVVHEESKAEAEPKPKAESLATPTEAMDNELASTVKSGEVETQAYVVLFEANSPVPAQLGTQMIREAADSVRGKGSYDIVISKRIGSSAGPDLFEARAKAVKQQLATAGVDAKKIRVKGASGQSEPASGASYRAEIFLGE